MSLPLPPDPYVALGLTKAATLAEIRSAHRKLVIKCHPDKVQDPTLKELKQAEFHKVQQAYELLSDDKRRVEYDDTVKLVQLRKERDQMRPGPGPSPPTGRAGFDYDIRHAAPTSSTFKTRPREPTTVYTRYPQSRSEEDHLGQKTYEYAEEPTRTSRARKAQSYEEPTSRKPARESKEDEKRRERREADDAKLREKNAKESKKREKERESKQRDTERRKGKEEKHSRTSRPFVVDAASTDEDDFLAAKFDRKTERKRAEEERLRQLEEETRAAAKADKARRKREEEISERHRKEKAHASIAAQYMQASKSKSRKSAEVVDDTEFRPPQPRRAETFNEGYGAKFASNYEDDDFVRRSSAQRQPRRASEQIPEPRSRDIPRDLPREIPIRPSRERKNSYEGSGRPVVVDATPAFARAPAMPGHTSSPANLESMVNSRDKPSRSRTMPTATNYSSQAAPHPPMMRASTFTQGTGKEQSSREPTKPSRTPGSRLKQQVPVSDSDSDSDDAPVYAQRSASPTRMHRQPMPETRTSYKVSKEGVVPNVKYSRDAREHRQVFRSDDDYDQRDRSDRSRSREGARRSAERPPLARSGGSNRQSSSTRQPQAYYEEPTPIIKEARPKMSPRENSSSRSNYFDHVAYTKFDPVSYADGYGRRGHDQPANNWEAGVSGGYAYTPRVRESARA